jgi:hypothetical protein
MSDPRTTPEGPYDPQPATPGPSPDVVPPGHNPTEVPVNDPIGIPATDPDGAPGYDPGPGTIPSPSFPSPGMDPVA